MGRSALKPRCEALCKAINEYLTYVPSKSASSLSKDVGVSEQVISRLKRFKQKTVDHEIWASFHEYEPDHFPPPPGYIPKDTRTLLTDENVMILNVLGKFDTESKHQIYRQLNEMDGDAGHENISLNVDKKDILSAFKNKSWVKSVIRGLIKIEGNESARESVLQFITFQNTMTGS